MDPKFEKAVLGPGAVILSVPMGLNLIGSGVNRALQGLLRLRSKSQYSHAAIMLNNNHVMDSQPSRGVGSKSFRLWKAGIDVDRSIVLIPDLDRLGISEDRLRNAIKFEMGVPYGYAFLGVLAKRDMPNAVFCSQFIAKVYNAFLPAELVIDDRVLPIDLEELLTARGFRRHMLAEIMNFDENDNDELSVEDLSAIQLEHDFGGSIAIAKVSKVAFAALAVSSANAAIQAAVHGGGGHSVGSNVSLLKQYGKTFADLTSKSLFSEFRLSSGNKVDLSEYDEAVSRALKSTKKEAIEICRAVNGLLNLAGSAAPKDNGQIDAQTVNNFLDTWRNTVFGNWMTFVVADTYINEAKQFDDWCDALSDIAAWVRDESVGPEITELWFLTEACAIALYLIADMTQPWKAVGLCVRDSDPKACGTAAFEKYLDHVGRAMAQYARGETDDLQWVKNLIESALTTPRDF